MGRDYVTGDDLDRALDRLAVAQSRIDELRRDAANRAHAEHQAAREATTEGEN